MRRGRTSKKFLSRMDPQPCQSCLLYRRGWQGISEETSLCIWFLKKLKTPQPIPAAVLEVGCKQWRGKGSTGSEVLI